MKINYKIEADPHVLVAIAQSKKPLIVTGEIEGMQWPLPRKIPFRIELTTTNGNNGKS